MAELQYSITSFMFVILMSGGMTLTREVTILSVHVGANPLYGYYAAAPVYRVATRRMRTMFPRSLTNLTYIPIFLPGYDLCQDSGDHTAEFFARYYYTHYSDLTATNNYLILASPECTNQALVLADFARDLDIPFFASVAGDSRLADRKRYPTTSAVGPLSGSDVLLSLEELLKRFSWRTVSLVCDSMTQLPGLANFFYARCLDIKKLFVQRGYNWVITEYNSAVQRDFAWYLGSTKNQSRIYVILTTPPFLRQMMIEASRQGMTSGDFVFISVQPTKRPGIMPVSWRGNGTHEDDAMALDAFKCLLVITGVVPVWSRIQALTSEIARTAQEDYQYVYPVDDQENDMQIGIYESTMMFGQVFDENYPAVINMTKTRFIDKFANRSFSFADRNYSTDASGGKVSPVVIQRLNTRNEQMETAMLFHTQTRIFFSISHDLWYWVGRNSSPPDIPACGFRNDLCDAVGSGTGIMIGVVCTILTLLLMAGGFALNYHIEKKRELRRLWWLVGRSALSRTELDENDKESGIVDTVLGYTYDLNNKIVYGLVIQSPRALTVQTFVGNTKLLSILLSLHYLNHPNLAALKGLSLGAGHVVFVSEYGDRGTLRALLDDPGHVALDNSLRFALCWDLLEAVEYLHRSSLGCHGNLSSLTCIIDARFTAKIAEAGYAKIFDYLGLSKSSPANQPQLSSVELIWKPPEVLALISNPRMAVTLTLTTQCDIYALGIIFYETVTGRRPMDIDFDSPTAILAASTALAHDFYGMRRQLTQEKTLPIGLRELLMVCVGPAATRPSARQLRLIFQKVRPRSNDVVGHILRRIEKHASYLEEVVSERTRALETEMTKADALLREMLPREIVVFLRNKQPVPSELFESVTIMFTDLPAFAAITTHCDPLQIIDFLNSTYTLIDDVLPEFDVYKVETVNDCYIVVSGLPVANGIQHVFEVCRLAVTLLKATRGIQDPTNRTQKVLLRIGVHTGACVAGVIGRRMPRYCLFGDSMNTASRMESHGNAGKIHISSATREHLDRSPNFITESRGQLEIKGKGLMETFWLTERH